MSTTLCIRTLQLSLSPQNYFEAYTSFKQLRGANSSYQMPVSSFLKANSHHSFIESHYVLSVPTRWTLGFYSSQPQHLAAAATSSFCSPSSFSATQTNKQLIAKANYNIGPQLFCSKPFSFVIMTTHQCAQLLAISCMMKIEEENYGERLPNGSRFFW